MATSLQLRQHAQGTILPVRAKAGARRNEVAGVHDGALVVRVTQAPENGKANQALAKLLAKFFGVSPQQVQLLCGDHSPRKQYLLVGVVVEVARSRIV